MGSSRYSWIPVLGIVDEGRLLWKTLSTSPWKKDPAHPWSASAAVTLLFVTASLVYLASPSRHPALHSPLTWGHFPPESAHGPWHSSLSVLAWKLFAPRQPRHEAPLPSTSIPLFASSTQSLQTPSGRETQRHKVAAQVQHWLDCISTQGHWEKDPSLTLHPETLPWPHPSLVYPLLSRLGNSPPSPPVEAGSPTAAEGSPLMRKYQHCDSAFWRRRGLQPEAIQAGTSGAGNVSHSAALPLRLELQYVWRVPRGQQKKALSGQGVTTGGLEASSDEAGHKLPTPLPWAPALSSAKCAGALQQRQYRERVHGGALCSTLLGRERGKGGRGTRGGWRGGSILFVGDSLQAQMAQSLVFSLKARGTDPGNPISSDDDLAQQGISEGHRSQGESTFVLLQPVPVQVLSQNPGGREETRGEGGLAQNCLEALQRHPKLLHLDACFAVDICASGADGTQPRLARLAAQANSDRQVSRLAFVRNDFLSLVRTANYTKGSIDIQLPWLSLLSPTYSADSGSVLPFRVVVLNRGMHYVGGKELLSSLNTTLHAVRETCPKCLIIFRNTPPGHANCTRSHQPLDSPQLQDSLPFQWGLAAAQSRLARSLVKGVGGLYLDVASATALRGDGHVGTFRRTREDCLHYCLPGPVDTWVLLLYNALLNAL